eukprot:gene12044-2634_t
MSPAKKFRSIRRKVRKGFNGIKIQDIRKAEQIPSANASPVHATSPPLTSSAQGPSESGSVADQSFDLDSSFEVIDESSYETRNRSLQLGKRYEQIHPACGFKIIDFDLLKQSLEAAFICTLCKTDKTGIDIMVDEKKRKGLEESLSFVCKNCGNETILQTSKALTGRKVSEVNARSVIASSSMGHARLSDFCGTMGLPPPLAKSSYQQQLKNVCKHIVQATEGVLIEASEKLIQITEKEEPFQIQFDDSDSLPEVRQKKKNKARGATRKQVDDEHNNKRKRIDSEDDSNCQNITFIDEKEIAVLTEFKKNKV